MVFASGEQRNIRASSRMTKLSPSKSRFANVYLLHGEGGSPNGSVLNLEAVLQHAFYDTRFIRPQLPYAEEGVSAEESLDYLVLQYRKEIIPNSLFIGVSLGGLLAAQLQELSPQLNLTVVALMSPTSSGLIKVEEKNDKRLALYSSDDKQIAGRTNWPAYAECYDLPMLRYHDTNLCKYAVCYLISQYIQGKDMAYEVNNLFPTTAELLPPGINPA
jgi:pimeloyl-ACP methyl ester carboxylesterase